ncbi:hypothetical protein EBR03_06085 [bacterium]|nr:hypothetical protein [bacterium]
MTHRDKKKIVGIAKKNKEEKQKRILDAFRIADEVPEEMIVETADPVQVEYTEADKPMHSVLDISADKAITRESLLEIGGQDLTGWALHLLKVEWATKYASTSIRDYLLNVRGLSHKQYNQIMALAPKPEWDAERAQLLDGITSDLVKRQIDLIAENQERHISGANVALARAIEMLSKGSIEIVKTDKEGNVKRTVFPLRSSDIMNLATAIEKAQQIYRRAMGLPNDEGGMAQLIEKINQMKSEQVIQNNLQINIQQSGNPNITHVERLASQLSYDQILEFINYRREKKALESNTSEENSNDKTTQR